MATRSLAAAAVGAGFHFIDGDALAHAMHRPGRVVEFQLAGEPPRPSAAAGD